MNNSLLRLQNKLNLQLKDLEMHLQSAQAQIQLLKKQILSLEVQMNQTNFNSFTINPDIEINRLSFITQNQQNKEELTLSLKNQHDLENKLKERMQRIHAEASMLENYLQRE